MAYSSNAAKNQNNPRGNARGNGEMKVASHWLNIQPPRTDENGETVFSTTHQIGVPMHGDESLFEGLIKIAEKHGKRGVMAYLDRCEISVRAVGAGKDLKAVDTDDLMAELDAEVSAEK